MLKMPQRCLLHHAGAAWSSATALNTPPVAALQAVLTTFTSVATGLQFTVPTVPAGLYTVRLRKVSRGMQCCSTYKACSRPPTRPVAANNSAAQTSSARVQRCAARWVPPKQLCALSPTTPAFITD